MALIQIPYQNIQIEAPEDGEVWRDPDNKGNLYVRQGTTIYTINLGYADGRIQNTAPLQQAGIAFESIPIKRYDMGTFARVMNSGTNVSSPAVSTTDINLFKSQPTKTGEVITQQISAANANSPVVTSSVSGVISDPQKAGANPNATLADIAATVPSGTVNAPAIPVQQPVQTASLSAAPQGATISQADYQLKPGETLDQYNARLASLRSATSTNNSQTDASLLALLNDPNLSSDQKHVIQSIYNAISTNDTATADRIKAAMAAATQYSDPYFKAQIRIATDALDRAFKAQDGDLAFQEQQKQNALADLQRDTAAAKDYLSLEEQQQLKDLERTYTSNLDATRNELAARGFTNSSVRARKEKILSDTYGDMRQSTQRSVAYKKTGLTNQLTDLTRNTALQIDRLRQLAAEGKLNALRSTEEKVGSSTLQNLGYSNVLGGVGGSIPRQQVLDATQFANGFIF